MDYNRREGGGLMSRPVRTISPTGMYHIIIRGLNGLTLFGEKADFLFFLEQFQQVSGEFSVYAYCLLPGEVQIFLRESVSGAVPGMMRRLLTRYAGWFNRKYHRKGSVTEGRYQCAIVLNKDEANLVRYIHQTPVRAGICETAGEYDYSSFSEYFDGWITARRDWFEGGFEAYHQQEEGRDFTIRPSGKLTDRQVKEQVDFFCRDRGILDWNVLSKNERNELLSLLRERFSIGQLQTATGLSRGIIARCMPKEEQNITNNRQMESFLL